MKTNKIYDITVDTEDTIITATLSKPNEVVMLLSSGDVIRFNLDEQKGEQLFSVKSNIHYTDGGFDINAPSSIYTMDEIVVLVNDYKLHGFVHYPGKYYALRLFREDYYADMSVYPIALYKNAEGIPHLIYGQAWNHIQIMNLDSRQILTAAKSLIKENAEEEHIEFYKKHSEDNKLAWPSPYDYFFGELYVSPNSKLVLSAGWAWGSCDYYNVYDIEKFISSNRITDLPIGGWEHANRASCWVDNNTIAVTYSPFMEGDDNANADTLCEIHFHKINGDTVEVERSVQVSEKNILQSAMHFNSAMNAFIVISETDGLAVISLDGQTLFKDETLKSNKIEYCSLVDSIIITGDKTISVYKITKPVLQPIQQSAS